MRLFFARHGESRANIERVISNRDLPYNLTEKGRGQASSLADRLAREGISRIYTSPVPRARETARIVAERFGLEVNTEDALREIDCGSVEGRGDSEAWHAHDEMLRRWNKHKEHDYRIQGGESLNDVKLRFIPFVRELPGKLENQDEACLLISHGNTLHHMLPIVLFGLEWGQLEEESIGTCGCITADLRQGKLVYTGRL